VNAHTRPRRAAALANLDPGTYRRHSLHAPDCLWQEKNCYVDIWIELLHALGLEPLAMLPFTVAVDFAGDQWTFFKPPHEDLLELYGVGVQELYVWRTLLDHALEHLAAGRVIATEADAFWLPDTAGTDYRLQHTKTTIVLNEIDVGAARLGYFHNAGYFTLSGEDFTQLFRVGAPPDPTFMPLFAELVRSDRSRVHGTAELRRRSRVLLLERIQWRPRSNPMPGFQARFNADLPWLISEGLPLYHAWAFGTLRQLGTAAELSAQYLNWLEPGRGPALEPGPGLAQAEAAFTEISALCKALILKVARAVNSKREPDVAASFASLTAAWDRADSVLRELR
jgi:hypothetical protein